MMRASEKEETDARSLSSGLTVMAGIDISAMDPYSIPDLSVAMSAAKVQNQVAESVMAKTLDVTEQGGQALIDMMRSSMERSVNPAVGGNVDVRV